jgi:hypothetical protein
MRWRRIFKGLSQDGGRADFSKNFRASPFDKYPNEPNFCQKSTFSDFETNRTVSDKKTSIINKSWNIILLPIPGLGHEVVRILAP